MSEALLALRNRYCFLLYFVWVLNNTVPESAFFVWWYSISWLSDNSHWRAWLCNHPRPIPNLHFDFPHLPYYSVKQSVCGRYKYWLVASWPFRSLSFPALQHRWQSYSAGTWLPFPIPLFHWKPWSHETLRKESYVRRKEAPDYHPPLKWNSCRSPYKPLLLLRNHLSEREYHSGTAEAVHHNLIEWTPFQVQNALFLYGSRWWKWNPRLFCSVKWFCLCVTLPVPWLKTTLCLYFVSWRCRNSRNSRTG